MRFRMPNSESEASSRRTTELRLLRDRHLPPASETKDAFQIPKYYKSLRVGTFVSLILPLVKLVKLVMRTENSATPPQQAAFKHQIQSSILMKKRSIVSITALLALAVTACSYSHQNSENIAGQIYEPSPRIDAQALGEEPEPTEGKAQPLNTENYTRIVENPYADPLKTPYSTFSIDVDAASYANMRRFINDGQMPPADAIRTEELVNYFDFNYPQPTGEDPFSITTEVATCPWNAAHQLVHIGLQGKEIPTENLPASNLVFLIDVSGSMEEPNKLPLVQQSLSMLTNELRPQDRVAIVVYAGAAGLVLPSTPGDRRGDILEALENLKSGGSTAGGAGIQLAYKVAKENFVTGGNNRVILASDGDFNVGMHSDGEMERLIEHERESGVFLTVLAYGTGNYQDAKMQLLADKGNGNHAYIDNIMEANKVLVHEFGGTLFTIAKDVKIQVEFNPTEVKAYRLIGYENRLLAAEDFNNDQKDAGELGSGHTVTALYELIPAGSSEMIGSVDATKYQTPTASNRVASKLGELFQVKFRYKQPDGNESKLITRVQPTSTRTFASASEDFRWSAAVAEFSAILRQSEFLGDANYGQVIETAQAAIGRDTEGYRQEFVGLVKRTQLLDNRAPMARR
jgi:Ca-activated chloride channel homolog